MIAARASCPGPRLRSMRTTSTGKPSSMVKSSVTPGSSQRTARSFSRSKVRIRPSRKTGWSSTMPRRIRRAASVSFEFPRLEMSVRRIHRFEAGRTQTIQSAPWPSMTINAAQGRLDSAGLATLRAGNRLLERNLQAVQGLWGHRRVFDPDEEGVRDAPPGGDLSSHASVPVRLGPRCCRQPTSDYTAQCPGAHLQPTGPRLRMQAGEDQQAQAEVGQHGQRQEHCEEETLASRLRKARSTHGHPPFCHSRQLGTSPPLGKYDKCPGRPWWQALGSWVELSRRGGWPLPVAICGVEHRILW